MRLEEKCAAMFVILNPRVLGYSYLFICLKVLKVIWTSVRFYFLLPIFVCLPFLTACVFHLRYVPIGKYVVWLPSFQAWQKKLDTLSINQANTQTLHLIRWTYCCGISKMCVLKTFKVRNRQYVAKSVFILTLFTEFHKFPEASCLTVLTLDKWTQLQGGHSCLGTLCQFVTVCPQISPASPAFLHLFPGPGVFLICPLFLYYSLVFFSSAIFILWPAFTLLLL